MSRRYATVALTAGETTVYDTTTAAFHSGETPAWECPECGKTFYRGDKQRNHTLDLYGRGD